MFHTNTRDDFLQSFWLRYPPLPDTSLQVWWGRLRHHTTAARVERPGSQVFEFNWSEIRWCDGGLTQTSPHAPAAVLQDQDLVAVIKQDDTLLIRLLAPCLEEKVETQWTLESNQKWNKFVDALRDFFKEQKFLEVATPLLVPSPGTEPFLEPFTTELHLNGQTRKYFLPFSPEFHLKKLLSLGWEKIYEMKPCFRNNEWSPTHQPEFWMLEWYRAGATLENLLKDVNELIQRTSALFQQPPRQLERVTVAELFKQTYGFTLTPHTTYQQMWELAERQLLHPSETDTWDDLFFRLFLEKIERALGFDGPVAVCSYPPSQAALARLNSEGWAERFEIYWQGLELANAFFELNDPEEQQRRFAKELMERQGVRGGEIALDPEFIQALRHGMPPSAGIALGVERLFMCAAGLHDIGQARAFPVKG